MKRVHLICQVMFICIQLLGFLYLTNAADVYNIYHSSCASARGGDGPFTFDGSHFQKEDSLLDILSKLQSTVITRTLIGSKLVETLGSRDVEIIASDSYYGNSFYDSEIFLTADCEWNPHKVGLSSSIWYASFNENATLTLHNPNRENGHVAMGIWWHQFPSNSRIPLDGVEVKVEFDIALHQIECNPDDSFLRIALASAILDDTGSVRYTEIDLWDSPVTDELPENPDLIHVSNEVVEYKFAQIPAREKIHIVIPLSEYIYTAWDSRVDSAHLESIYFVIESLEESHDSQDYVEISVDNFRVKFDG